MNGKIFKKLAVRDFENKILNQARAGLWPAHAWFLEIVSVRMSVCVCVCPPPRLLITSGVMWRDMDLIRLVKQVLQLLYCMATVVIIVNGHGLGIGTRRRHKPHKS